MADSGTQPTPSLGEWTEGKQSSDTVETHQQRKISGLEQRLSTPLNITSRSWSEKRKASFLFI